MSSLLSHYGYAAVAVILLLENLGIPFPGETILIAAAVSAGAGDLNIFFVAATAIVAAIAGSCLGYLIGARGGRGWLERWGRYVRLTPARLDRMESFVSRRGVPLILVGRFIEGVRQFSGLIAGFSELRWRSFALATSVGAVVWVAAWASLGYFAGNHVHTISRYATYFAIGAVVVIIGWFAIRAIVRRRHRAGAPAQG